MKQELISEERNKTIVDHFTKTLEKEKTKAKNELNKIREEAMENFMPNIETSTERHTRTVFQQENDSDRDRETTRNILESSIASRADTTYVSLQ